MILQETIASPATSSPNPWAGRRFSNVLQGKQLKAFIYYGEEEDDFWEIEMMDQFYLEKLEEKEDNENWCEIELTTQRWFELCRPWRKALIIKLLGRNISYRTLTERLTELWKFPKGFELTDLEYDYFLVRFYTMEDYYHVLKKGP